MQSPASLSERLRFSVRCMREGIGEDEMSATIDTPKIIQHWTGRTHRFIAAEPERVNPWRVFENEHVAQCYLDWAALRKKPTCRERIVYRLKLWAMMLGLRRRLPWR